MNSTELYEAFRADVVDEAKPYLWSDAEVFRYMDYAYRMFVRLTGGVKDVTSEATELAVTTGEKFSELHPSVLHIVKATLRSDGRELSLINSPGAAYQIVPDTSYGAVSQATALSSSGAVRYVIVGVARNTVQLAGVPVVDDTIDLEIYRTPLVIVSTFDEELVDVAEEHHERLLDGMKSRAYRKNDSETFDRTRAVESEASFIEYAEFVRLELERRRHTNQPIAYGGI